MNATDEDGDVGAVAARTEKLTRDNVHAAADQLFLRLRRRPAVREVMAHLGTTTVGTVHKYLQTWSDAGVKGGAAPGPAVSLWAAALESARLEVRADRAALEQEREAFSQERAELQAKTTRAQREAEDARLHLRNHEALIEALKRQILQVQENSLRMEASHERAVGRLERQLEELRSDKEKQREAIATLGKDKAGLLADKAELRRQVSESGNLVTTIRELRAALPKLVRGEAEGAAAAAVAMVLERYNSAQVADTLVTVVQGLRSNTGTLAGVAELVTELQRKLSLPRRGERRGSPGGQRRPR